MEEKKLPKGITRRKDGRLMGRVQVDGERVSIYGKSVKEIQEQMEEIKYKMKHGIHCRPKEIRVNEWFKIWIDEYKSMQCKSQTILFYQNTYKRYIRDEIGSRRITDIKPVALQKIINTLYKNNYSSTTVKSVQTILSGMFSQALKDGIIVINPAMNLTLPRFRNGKAKERRVMSQEETAVFLQYAENSVYYDYYRLALCTGMRINEVLGLQWNDIDWKRKVICIRGGLVYESGRGIKKDTPKTQAGDREIPMIESSEQLLKDLWKKHSEKRLMLGDVWRERKGIENLVVSGVFGGSIYDTNVRKDIDRIIEKINADGISFEHITPHTFRHPYVKHKTKSFLRNSRVFKADFCAPSHSLCTEVFHFPDNINLISGVNIHTFNQCVSQGGI